ncbi:MAG: OmcA/MtrC family decaheme c-type cytochrome [Trichloromonadaceae bacterium]
MKNWKIGTKFFLVAFLAASLGLAGCSGDDGNAGAPGLPGTPGADGTAGAPGTPGSSVVDVSLQPAAAVAALNPTAEITGVTIASPPVVSFTVTDSTGRGIAGLGAIRAGIPRLIRINIAKLVPGTNGSPDSWVNYIRSSTGTPSTENTGTLVDNGDGSYVYTFANDIAAIAAVPYEPTLTHRVAAQIGDGALPLPAMNVTFDFVPAGGDVVLRRDIAHSGSCNECHSNLTIHGRRFAMEYCVTCHNPDLTGGAGDMASMTHKIHMGAYLTNGFELGGEDYSNVVFTMNSFSNPEGLRNCRKCHTGEDAQTPQGNNWRAKPSRVACGSCHDDVNFETGFLHGNRLTTVRTTAGLRQSVVDPAKTAIVQTSDANCTSCHVDGGPLGPEAVHRTWVSSDNNPEVPAWAKILQYEIESFTLANDADPITNPNRKVATVKFRMLAKQNSTDVFAPVNLNSLATVGATAQNLSFRLIWAAPQAAPSSGDLLDGPAIAAPQDWNNAFASTGPTAGGVSTSPWLRVVGLMHLTSPSAST